MVPHGSGPLAYAQCNYRGLLCFFQPSYWDSCQSGLCCDLNGMRNVCVGSRRWQAIYSGFRNCFRHQGTRSWETCPSSPNTVLVSRGHWDFKIANLSSLAACLVSWPAWTLILAWLDVLIILAQRGASIRLLHELLNLLPKDCLDVTNISIAMLTKMCNAAYVCKYYDNHIMPGARFILHIR